MKSKLLWFIALLLLFFAVRYGIDSYREREASESVRRQMEQLREKASAIDPDMPEILALQEAASVETEEAVNSAASANERGQNAAAAFFGFYLINQTTRYRFCLKHGVDIQAFRSAFEAAHRDEYAKAVSALSMNSEKLAELYRVLQGQLEPAISDDMAYIARNNGVSTTGACHLFEDNVDIIIPKMSFSVMQPVVHAALMNRE